MADRLPAPTPSSSSALTPSTSALDADPVVEAGTWPAATTVQAIREQFPQLVITKAVDRYVEFSDKAALEHGKSRKFAVFGDRTQIDPFCPSPSSAGTPLPSSLEPLPAPAPAPTTIPATKEEYEYTRCSECERSNPDYKGCNHPEDRPDSIPGPPRPISSVYNTLSQTLTSLHNSDLSLSMLRTGALSALFTENLDDAVKGIFVTTVGGNIIAKDAVTPNRKIKRACALGALTWRVNRSLALGDDPTQVARVQSLRTMDTEVTTTNWFKSMVVDLEGEMVAVEFIKEGLLIGVFGEKIKKKVVTKVDETGNTDVDNQSGRVDDSGEAVDAGDIANANDTGDADAAEDDMSTKSSQTRGETNEHEENIGEEGEPEWHDIKVKAEAMAEYLRDELRDFKMPASLEGLE